MNRNKSKMIAVLIGIVIIVGMTVGFHFYIKEYEHNITTMKTYVPSRFIQAGEEITKSMIHQATIPTMQHRSNAYTHPNDIIGQRAVVPIGTNEEFMDWKLTKDNIYPTAGQEFFPFQINFVQSINDMVRRGDEVDIWVDYKKPVEEKGQKIYSKKILSNITVAYVKDTNGKEIKDSSQNTALQALEHLSKSEKDQYTFQHFRDTPTAKPSYMTFIMTPEQYQTLVEAEQKGTITLGMKNPFIQLQNEFLKGREDQ